MFIAKLTKPCVLLAMAGALSTSPALAQTAAATNAAPASKPAAKATDLFADALVAKGKGVKVSRSQLDEAVVSIKSSVAARGQSLPPEQIKMIEQQVVDRLIQIQLLSAKATAADKAKGQEVWTNTLERLKTRAGNDETLNRQLKSVGMTLEELRTKLTEEATAQAALEREMNISVSDAEVKKFYDENPSKFEQPEMVRASHILLSTRDMETGKDLSDEQKAAKKKKAQELLERARKGEDFAKLAKEFSEDPGSKDNGGEYKFPRGQMVPEFETTAFALKTNEVSDIVTTQFGYHIIKLSEKIPAQKVEFAKVAPDIKEHLKQQSLQKMQDQVRAYVEKLKKDAGVEILDDSLKPKENAELTLPPSEAPAKKPDAKTK